MIHAGGRGRYHDGVRRLSGAARATITGGLFAVAGCTDTYEVAGRQVKVEADVGFEMCAGTLEHMDRFVERLAAEVGIVLPGEPWIDYRWMSRAQMVDEGRCNGAYACAGLGTVWAPAIPVDHELVHAAIAHVSLPHSFFIEGLAEAFSLDIVGHAEDYWSGPQRPGGDEEDVAAPKGVVEVLELTRVQLSGRYYPLAGGFSRYLIDRFGMKKFFELYQRSVWSESLRATEATFLDVFGAPLSTVAAEFEAMFTDCGELDYPLKLLECEAPELAWDGARWAGYVPLDCADPESIGRVGSFEIRRTLTIPADATYRVAVRNPSAWVEIGSCGGCERPATAIAGLLSDEVYAALPAGRYYVRIGSTSEAPDDVGFVVEKVADGLAPGGSQ